MRNRFAPPDDPPPAAVPAPEAAPQPWAAPELSVVVPIFNEEETLPELEARLSRTLRELGVEYEVIFVNDGSSDRSASILHAFATRDRRLKAIHLSRNFGHQPALLAGLRRSSGRGVVLMDGDLQDPPEVIRELYARWQQGYEVVFAVRTKRKENLLKRAAYRFYYRLLRVLAEVSIPIDSGDFSLMDRRVVALLCGMPERNKFLRGLRSWVGFRQTSVVYERDARFAGQPKYSVGKLVRLGLDGIASYSHVPLRLAFVLGLIVSICSFGLAAVYFLQRLLVDAYIPQGFTTLAILILFLGGVQLLAVGLIGEYIGRIYDEVKRRPEYIEQGSVGFDEPRPGPGLEVPGAAVDAAPVPSTLPD